MTAGQLKRSHYPAGDLVKIKLLQPFQGLKEGREWNCPLASLAKKLIEEGKALAVEACDLHLNPQASTDPPENRDSSASGDTTNADSNAGLNGDATPPAAKPKRQRNPRKK